MTFFSHLFPCRFKERLCQDTPFGCRCGKKGGSKKAERRADDLANQAFARGVTEQQQAFGRGTSEQKSLEQKFQPSDAQNALLTQLLQQSNLTPEQLFRQIGPQAGTLADRIAFHLNQTPEQLFRGISPTAGTLADRINLQFNQTPEQLFRGISPTASQYADIVGQQLTTPPQISFQDTLSPELALAQDQIRNAANRRGILGSGLELEQMGRAGVDLAIKEATLRQQNAFLNQQLAQQSRDRALGLTGIEQGLGTDALNRAAGLTSVEQGLGTDALNRASDLTSTEQGLSQDARTRYQNYLQALRNQQLTGVEEGEQAFRFGQQSGNEALNRGELGKSQFDTLGFQALQNRIEQARQRDAAIAQALGSAAIGDTFGKGFGQSPTGTNVSSPLSVDELLRRSQQRNTQTPINFRDSLSLLAPTPGGF